MKEFALYRLPLPGPRAMKTRPLPQGATANEMWQQKTWPRVRALPEEEAGLPLRRRTALYQAVKEAVEFACEHASEPLTLTIALAPAGITVRLTLLIDTEQQD